VVFGHEADCGPGPIAVHGDGGRTSEYTNAASHQKTTVRPYAAALVTLAACGPF